MTYIYTNIATCDSVSILYSSVVESPKRRKNVLLQYQSTAECRRNGWTHGRVWVLKRLYRDDAILLSLLLSSRIRRARASLLPLCSVVVDGWMELVPITKGIDVRRPRERESWKWRDGLCIPIRQPPLTYWFLQPATCLVSLHGCRRRRFLFFLKNGKSLFHPIKNNPSSLLFLNLSLCLSVLAVYLLRLLRISLYQPFRTQLLYIYMCSMCVHVYI